jgi:hypothetical protein
MIRHSSLALPARRHLPGSGGNPGGTALETAGADAGQCLCHGVDLFNHGFFREAHEVWEAGWLAAAPDSGRRTGSPWVPSAGASPPSRRR